MLASAFSVTFGLAIVFFVAFPIIAQGLIAFAVGQGLGERRDNEEYRARVAAERSAKS